MDRNGGKQNKRICILRRTNFDHFQDWISITFLVFYISVFMIIISFIKEVRGDGVIHGPATWPLLGGTTGTTVVINQAPPAVVINQAVPLEQYPQQGYVPVPQVQQYPPQRYAPVLHTYPEQPLAYGTLGPRRGKPSIIINC